ncbi:MAG: glkA2 [Frankiales bacterium]|nr:glkA2 [Frankiales bacterium]
MSLANPAQRVPILEIGGTHVTAAWIETTPWRVTGAVRVEVDAQGTAADIVGAWAETAASLQPAAGARWGVAMPGPFDYVHGVARFAGVGKFDALDGVDVRAALMTALQARSARPSEIDFINDASAFLVGEWLAGAAVGADRCVAITLGTGVGSAFLEHGRVVDDDPRVPPEAEVHLLSYRGRPLEDHVSRRAIRRAYAAAGGDAKLDVREIAEAARAGEPMADRVFSTAFEVLGEVLAPWLAGFGAQTLVIGGSIVGSWDLVAPAIRRGLRQARDGGRDAGLKAGREAGSEAGLESLALVPAADAERSALIGAAYPVLTLTQFRPGSAGPAD